jgi:hypothetical protein
VSFGNDVNPKTPYSTEPLLHIGKHSRLNVRLKGELCRDTSTKNLKIFCAAKSWHMVLNECIVLAVRRIFCMLSPAKGENFVRLAVLGAWQSQRFI